MGDDWDPHYPPFDVDSVKWTKEDDERCGRRVFQYYKGPGNMHTDQDYAEFFGNLRLTIEERDKADAIETPKPTISSRINDQASEAEENNSKKKARSSGTVGDILVQPKPEAGGVAVKQRQQKKKAVDELVQSKVQPKEQGMPVVIQPTEGKIATKKRPISGPGRASGGRSGAKAVR